MGAVRDQQPRQLLLVEPAAALDGVHEMPLDRVGRRERDVVAALHHAGAAAFAEQALHRDGDVELGPRLLGVQRREQAGAAGAEDQDVGVEGLHARTIMHARRRNLSGGFAPLLRTRGRRDGIAGQSDREAAVGYAMSPLESHAVGRSAGRDRSDG